MDASLERVEAIQVPILGYLVAHPEASDSIAGIHRWWLDAERGGFQESEVRVAVERLTRSGILQRRALPDGSAVYAGCAAP